MHAQISDNSELVPETKIARSRLLFFAFVLLTFAGYIGLDALTPYYMKIFRGFFLMILVVGQRALSRFTFLSAVLWAFLKYKLASQAIPISKIAFRGAKAACF